MIFAKNDIELKVWKGTKLCVKRMKRDFWNLNIVGPNDSCPSFMKKCGVIDTFSNSICVNINEKSPINDLAILPAENKNTI
jgi:hypothetical protein